MTEQSLNPSELHKVVPCGRHYFVSLIRVTWQLPSVPSLSSLPAVTVSVRLATDACCARFAFIYDPGSKAQLLGASNARSQWLAFQRAFFESATQGGAMPYMLLRVSAATSAHCSGCIWSSVCA